MKKIFLLTLSLACFSAFSQEEKEKTLKENQAPSATALTGASRGSTEIYTSVDKTASFPGGMSEFKQYIKRNLEIYNELKKKFPNTKTSAEFIVETDGSLSDIKIKSDYGQEMVDQFGLILKKGPKWQPAMLSEEPVRSKVIYNLNVE